MVIDFRLPRCKETMEFRCFPSEFSELRIWVNERYILKVETILGKEKTNNRVLGA